MGWRLDHALSDGKQKARERIWSYYRKLGQVESIPSTQKYLSLCGEQDPNYTGCEIEHAFRNGIITSRSQVLGFIKNEKDRYLSYNRYRISKYKRVPNFYENINDDYLDLRHTYPALINLDYCGYREFYMSFARLIYSNYYRLKDNSLQVMAVTCSPAQYNRSKSFFGTVKNSDNEYVNCRYLDKLDDSDPNWAAADISWNDRSLKEYIPYLKSIKIEKAFEEVITLILDGYYEFGIEEPEWKIYDSYSYTSSIYSLDQMCTVILCRTSGNPNLDKNRKSKETAKAIYHLLESGYSNEFIMNKYNISINSIRAYKAHITMGTNIK